MLILLAALGALSAPQALALPVPGQVLAETLAANGVQTYRCAERADMPGTYAWAFEAPQATLSDASGRTMARHFAGPTWVASDGGRVTGQVLAKADSPDGLGVDWLLLRATGAPARGLFSGVAYVRRLLTTGGQAPPTGCSAATAGQMASAPYSAVYEFYRPGR